MESLFIDYGIPAAMWLTIIAAGIAVLFAIVYTISNLIYSPKDTMKGIIGMLLLLGLIFVAWSTASGDKIGWLTADKYEHISNGIVKLVSSGITVAVIMSAFALGISLLLEFVNVFR